MKAQHRRRGVIARLDAIHLSAFSRNDKHDKTKTSDPIWSITPLFGILLLAYSLLNSACAIRTSETEQYFGPVLYVTGKDAAVQSMSEQIHFPFLVEAGTQWGLSLGIAKRVRVAPVILIPQGNPDSTRQPERLTILGGLELSPNTFLSLFYLRTTPGQQSEFLVRSVIGSSFGIGTEQNILLIGVTHQTELRPLTSGIHYLCYSSARPGATTYIVSQLLDAHADFDCGRMS